MIDYPEIQADNPILSSGPFPQYPEKCPVCGSALKKATYWWCEYECKGRYEMIPKVPPVGKNIWRGYCRMD